MNAQKKGVLLILMACLGLGQGFVVQASVVQAKPGTKSYSWALLAGSMTDNVWYELVKLERVDHRSAYLFGLALGDSRELGQGGRFRVEREIQVLGHLGGQQHFEFNAAWGLRWRFLSYGVGPSWATQTPREEVARAGLSQPLLFYWHLSAEIPAPWTDGSWSILGRIHHRSGVFGLISDGGGSNWLVLGVRGFF